MPGRRFAPGMPAAIVAGGIPRFSFSTSSKPVAIAMLDPLPRQFAQGVNLFDLPRPRQAELLRSWGIAPVHVGRLWKYLYREDSHDPAAMVELPARLRARLADCAWPGPLTVCRQAAADDGLTHKLLVGLADGCQVETVLMRYRDRVTACLSTQVGCPLACVFCATGQLGYTRNLRAGEIVAQALHVRRMLLGRAADDAADVSGGRTDEPSPLRNLVLMGMGEPLLNYEAVMDALDILRDPGCLAIGGKQITLSTVGVPGGIRRMADERRPYSLAVSLHGATQEERLALVPAARSWPLDELVAACRYYAERLGRKIFFEWTLIAGQNDSSAHAERLGELLRSIQSQVNLIPLNPTAGYAAQPGDAESIARFRAVLTQCGIPSSVRQRRGIDIAAGCGQLAGSAA